MKAITSGAPSHIHQDFLVSWGSFTFSFSKSDAANFRFMEICSVPGRLYFTGNRKPTIIKR